MGSDEKTSQWHEEEAWVKRLLRDQELLRERIGHKQVMSLGTFLTMLDRDGMADFLIIYGKAAREGIADSNDVDFYFEAARIRDENDAQRHIQVDEEHEGVRFHAYGWPSGRGVRKLDLPANAHDRDDDRICAPFGVEIDAFGLHAGRRT
jgi:hypothetical protein